MRSRLVTGSTQIGPHPQPSAWVAPAPHPGKAHGPQLPQLPQRARQPLGGMD